MAFRSHEEESDDDEHNINEPEYEDTSISLFANPSSLVKRRNVQIDTDHDLSSNPMEQILHEYATACQIYGCSSRINAGILTTFRYRLPSLRVSGSFFDADMLALVEVLLHHVNGALSYIRRLDFSLAAVEGKQFGKRGIRSHGAFALAKVLEISGHIEEVFLPGQLKKFWYSLDIQYSF
jgi:hypothetical protein